MGEGHRSGEMSRYTVEEAAALLGMTIGAVRNRLSQGPYGALKSTTGRSTSYWAGQSVRLVERIVGEFEAKYTAERNYQRLMGNYRLTLGREETPT